MTNKTLAIVAAVPAKNPNPKIAAITAITKKIITQVNSAIIRFN